MFPYVNKGDKFKPNVNFDNACRKLVNQFAGHGIPSTKNRVVEQTKVQCYNSTSQQLKSGSSVCFDEEANDSLNTILPVTICDSDDKIFGVLDDDLEVGACGSVSLSGVVRIQYSGEQNFVVPDFEGGFVGADTGTPVLRKMSDGSSFILLTNTVQQKSYNGPFAFSILSDGKLKIKAGFLNRNGKIFNIPETTFSERKEGYICVTSKFDVDKNTWSDPEIAIADVAADAYPIGYSKKIDQESGDPLFEFECYEVPMAFILYTKECPLAAKNNG